VETLFRQEIVVERPRLEVFEFAIDLERAPLWNPTVLRAVWLTPGPVAPGHRFKEWRHMDGREQTGEVEVRAHRAPELHELGAGYAGVDVRFRFFFDEAEDAVTRVRLEALLKARWYAKPLARAVGDQLRTLDEDILERLKVAIEIP
jgi:hypothetical protein